MSAGGKRDGAGRKRGEPNRRTVAMREIADKAVAQGITPLEVMLVTMRELYEAGDKQAASTVAKDAAPYVHPKLAQVQHQGDEQKPFKMLFGWMPPGS